MFVDLALCAGTMLGGYMQKEFPVRKPLRLSGYDYSRTGYYFVTICVKDRQEILGKIDHQQIKLSKYGNIVKQEIENTSKIRKECIIDKFIVMPNHIHLIVQIVGDDGNRPDEKRADCHQPLRKSIPNMVQGLKGAVTRKIGLSFWQRSYHEHIIRNEDEYKRIWQYIDENPAKWHEDRYYIRQNCE
jgi:REP element-mobilizing transposase RayT